MYWSWTDVRDFKRYVSWGEPKTVPQACVVDLQEMPDVKMHDGEMLGPNQSAVFMIQGDTSLGLGDSIWIVSFLRDFHAVKCRHLSKVSVVSSRAILDFYKYFLPKSFDFVPEFITKEAFDGFDCRLPSMFHWHEMEDKADRSWMDNRSMLQRMYAWCGMEYRGLPDWGEFASEECLNPSEEFWRIAGIDPKKDRYVYFQWHSSGACKNLSPEANIGLIRHITSRYGLKVCVVGRVSGLDGKLRIPGVINFSGKTEDKPGTLFALAFHSEFIVSPDSAGVHLAEAFRIPAVCIMSTLPPAYVASKYRIPAFMSGSKHCPYRPCGITTELPKLRKCPQGTGNHCRVLEEIDLELFDRCVARSFENRKRMRSMPAEDFYQAASMPIVVSE